MAAALIQFIAPRWWEEEKVSKLLASTHYEGEQQMRLIGNRLKLNIQCCVNMQLKNLRFKREAERKETIDKITFALWKTKSDE